jgi:hypothetical protein
MSEPTKRPSSKNPPRRPAPIPGPPSSQRDPASQRGPGFVWLLAPHPGRIRAVPIGAGGTLGRNEESTLRIDAPGIAPIHAKVDLVARLPGIPPEIYVTDGGTPSGTYVSGMRAQRTVLHDGDLLRLGGAIALIVERDVGTYDGPVIDDGGIVRGARSRRGWYAAVERAMAEASDGRRTAIVEGPSGAGRRSIVRRIADAWGVKVFDEADRDATGRTVDLETLEGEGAIGAAMTSAASRGVVVVRGAERTSASQQAALLQAMENVSAPVFAIVDAGSTLGAEVLAAFGHRIEIPSIETRREEIPTLIRARFERRGIAGNRLSIELYEALTRAAWPGEIEELVETVDAIADTNPDEPRLGPEHLQKPLARRGGRVPLQVAAADTLSEADRIRAALLEAKGSVAAAARALHLSRQALYREAARLGIDIRRTRDETGSAAQ